MLMKRKNGEFDLDYLADNGVEGARCFFVRKSETKNTENGRRDPRTSWDLIEMMPQVAYIVFDQEFQRDWFTISDIANILQPLFRRG
jgi:hypothetical protein